jgi:hypothetical protein
MLGTQYDIHQEIHKLPRIPFHHGKEKHTYPAGQLPYDEEGIITGSSQEEPDVFGDEAHHDIRYKTLSWQMVAVPMIAEIVSNGMLSLPSSGGVVGVGFYSHLPLGFLWEETRELELRDGFKGGLC